MKKIKYAIQIIGCGLLERYAIVQVTPYGCNPTTGRSYDSLKKAQTVAQCMGFEISAVGDIYQITA